MAYKEPITSRVVNCIVRDKTIKLFADEHRDAYIAPNGDGTLVIPIDSDTFSDWLMSFVMDKFDNHVLIGNQATSVTETLRGYAKYRGEGTIPLSLRVYADRDGNFWYDLGREAVKIMPNKWRLEAFPPIMFMRFYDCQRSQITPEDGGNAMDLFNFINVEDKYDRLLILAFVVFALVPSGNKPILSLSGQAGAGKTEASKIIKSLVDPTIPLVNRQIEKAEELDRMAQSNYVMAFDNLSSLTKKVSDHWCELATGLGVRIKKYYKTSEYITFEAIRPIIANGISQNLIESDVLTRAVQVELASRKGGTIESVYRERCEKARPKLLGAMFTLLSKSMAVVSKAPEHEWPRMGDFGIWCWAVAEALDDYSGEDAIVALDKMSESQHNEAMDANPIAQAIALFMKGKKTWLGTATDILDVFDSCGSEEPLLRTKERATIEVLKRSPYWPKDARALSVALKKVVPDLKTTGIEVEFARENNQRMIKIVNHPVMDGKEPEFDEADYKGIVK